MRIDLERLVLDGVGPFQGTEVLDLSGEDTAFCYAPNGHGKTTTIDLVRWLFEGKSALSSFRSLAQDEERKIINSKRFAEMSGGEVEAVLRIEDDGRYRVTRSIPFGTSPTSNLTVEAETDEGWSALDEPEEFLAKTVPRERLGFNLLTGEHIQEFVEGLKGPVVKESLQRLLRRPELVSARDALERIHADIADEATEQSREEKRLRNLKEKLSDLREQKNSLESNIDTETEKADELQREIDELNRELSEVESTEDLREEKAQLEAAIDQRQDRLGRQRSRLADTLTPSWRSVLKAAAQEPIETLLARHEEANEALETFQRNQAEIDYLEDLIEDARCYCGEPLTDKRAGEIEERITSLRETEPEVPDLPSDAWTLRTWLDEPGLAPVLKSLADHGELIQETAQGIEEARERIDEIEDALAVSDVDTERRIRAKMKVKRRERQKARDERQTYLRRHDTVTDRIDEVQAKIKETSIRDVDGKMLRATRQYAEAFDAAIQAALPSLHEQLRETVQDIFSRLFVKEDEGYSVKLSETSMVPRIVRENAEGEPEAIRLSEGEKTRLGLALLFALRQVAAERPFLLLDAPFSTLDDEGTHRLLELIGEHQGQVVVFTKNAFPEGRWFDAIAATDPRVFRMDWNQADSIGHQGYTEISRTEVDDLCLQGAA